MSNKNNPEGVSEMGIKILNGVNKAVHKLVESAAANNDSLIVGDEKGGFKSVPAKVLLKQLDK
jgi:hypothetical protein